MHDSWKMKVPDAAKTGDTIYHLVQDRKIKVGRMTRQMGISRKSFYNWVEGKSVPSTRNLVMLADYLGTTIDEIVSTTAIE